jgi:hypothetical protein
MKELLSLLLLPVVILGWALISIGFALAVLSLALFYRVQAFITGRPLPKEPPAHPYSIDP